MSVSLYRAMTWVSRPLINHYLDQRLKAGKEDGDRFEERKGVASCPRPGGSLVWIHAASIGESLSMISLIDRVILERPEVTVLMTSGTVSSARLLHHRLPENVIHQYIPVDRVPWVQRFLDHWKPDMALWVESEFWPSVLSEVKARKIPAFLMNARISAASFRGWRRAPWIIHRLLETFDLCMAQTELDADRLRSLGGRNVACPGNLKFAATPLPVDFEVQSAMEASIAGRPRWVAFSTHSGEEEIIADAHEILVRNFPDLLTILVPRHTQRAKVVEQILSERNLSFSVRSRSEPVNASKFFLLADTIGELGLFFRTTDIAFVGGTLVPHGGQNPIEPARLGCAIVHGAHMENFLAVESELMAAGASAVARSAEEIAREIGTLLTNSTLRQRRIAAAQSVADGKQSILDAVFVHIDPHLDRISPAQPGSVSRNARA
ncbi:MAG: 3-deoxy-D-manno-octulosonic acid transferase [Pseudomonadota bacterium]|nr:3-deoxy-D-manno-octulosonic acid transferase [Pseudomonadota bacterium]